MNSRTLVGMSCAPAGEGVANTSDAASAAATAARASGRISFQPRRITPFAPWTHEYTARAQRSERRSSNGRPVHRTLRRSHESTYNAGGRRAVVLQRRRSAEVAVTEGRGRVPARGGTGAGVRRRPDVAQAAP